MIIPRRNKPHVCPRVVAICLCGEVCRAAVGDYLGSVVVTTAVVVEFEVVDGPFGVVVVEDMSLLLLVLGSKGGGDGGGF